MLTRKLLPALATTAAVLGCAPAALAAEAGDLDPSFATAGIQTFAGANHARAVLGLPGGQVLAGVDRDVLRLNANGTPDPAFGGGDGRVELDLDGATDGTGGIEALARDAQGRYVALLSWHNTTGNRVGLVRLNADGTPDTTFSGDGLLLSEFGSDSASPRGLAIDSKGRIVAGGMSTEAGGGSDYGVLRVTAAGALDTTFSGDGRRTFPVTLGDLATAIDVDSKDRVVIGGATTTKDFSSFDNRATLVRLAENGEHDTTFDGDGVLRVVDPLHGDTGEQKFLDLDVDAQDRIVAAGYGYAVPYKQTEAHVVRVTAAGALDPTFDGDGMRVIAAGSFPEVRDVVTDAAGRVVVGMAPEHNTGGVALMRLQPGGAPDPAFAGGALRTVHLGTNAIEENVLDLALAADGRILLAGGWFGRGGGGAVVARVLDRFVADPVADGPGGGAGEQPPAGTVPAPNPPAAPANPNVAVPRRSAPSTRLAAPRLGRLTATRLNGTAGAGAVRVEVAVVRRTGGRCRALVAAKVRFRGGACTKPRWLRATGVARWTLALKGRLPRGRYEVRVRAVGADAKAGPEVRRTVRVR